MRTKPISNLFNEPISLQEEGILNEVCHCIQSRRKELGLNIKDQATLYVFATI